MIQMTLFKRIITCPLEMSFGTGLLPTSQARGRNDVSGDVRGMMECGTYPSQGRHFERSEATQNKQLKPEGLAASIWFSLGIHVLVVSFFMFSFLKSSVQMGTVVEIVWEASQTKSSLASSSTKVKVEKKVARSNHAAQPCKKITPRHSVEQDSSSGDDCSEKGHQKQQLPQMASAFGPQRQAYHPLPKYPWISRKRRQEGVVALAIKTNGEGHVIEVNLYKSSGHAPLDESALKIVKTWIFTESNIQKVLSIAFLLKNLEGKLEERA